MDPSTFTGVPRFSVPMVPLQNPSVPFIVVATFTHAGIMLHLTLIRRSFSSRKIKRDTRSHAEG